MESYFKFVWDIMRDGRKCQTQCGGMVEPSNIGKGKKRMLKIAPICIVWIIQIQKNNIAFKVEFIQKRKLNLVTNLWIWAKSSMKESRYTCLV